MLNLTVNSVVIRKQQILLDPAEYYFLCSVLIKSPNVVNRCNKFRLVDEGTLRITLSDGFATYFVSLADKQQPVQLSTKNTPCVPWHF
jgi:hypothetical protein